jgi:hypothetical protein
LPCAKALKEGTEVKMCGKLRKYKKRKASEKLLKAEIQRQKTKVQTKARTKCVINS